MEVFEPRLLMTASYTLSGDGTLAIDPGAADSHFEFKTSGSTAQVFNDAVSTTTPDYSTTIAVAAVAIAAGTLSALGQLLHNQPERDAASTTDQIAEDLLRIYGIPADEASEICRRPLPDLDSALPPESAT